MKFLNSNQNIYIKPTVVCIGFFDGLHLGHQQIFNQTIQISKKYQLKSLFFTFDKKFVDFINCNNNSLLTNNEKRYKVQKMNFDYYYQFNFTKDNCKLLPSEFMNFILLKFNVHKIVIGGNFRFGLNAAGTVQDLKLFFGDENVYVLPLQKSLKINKVISTTLIKKYLNKGDLENANKILISPYSILGNVIYGKQLGRIIGFPTTNIKIELILPYGTYITHLRYRNKTYNSMSCYYKTESGILLLETHILNKKINLYNKKIEVIFIKKLLDFKKIDNINELKLFISKCYDLTLDFFKNN